MFVYYSCDGLITDAAFKRAWFDRHADSRVTRVSVNQWLNSVDFKESPEKITCLKYEGGVGDEQAQHSLLTCLPKLTGLKYLHLWNIRGDRLHNVDSLAHLVNIKVLDVGHSRLTELPDWIVHMHNLQELNIADNQIAHLPDGLGRLVQLEKLSMYLSGLTVLPDWIGQLTRLNSMLLGSNSIKSLPESFIKLVNLQRLDLSNNKLTTLPASIGLMKNLKVVHLSNNKIATLPESMASLEKLEQLYIENCGLTYLPDWLGDLRNLQRLTVSKNRISNLPQSLSDLAKLRKLCLQEVDIVELPDWIGQLTDLLTLTISENKIKVLPNSMVNLQNLRSLVMNKIELREIPVWLGELSELEELSIADCPIKYLPDKMRNLKKLNTLMVRNVGLSEVPGWIGNLSNLKELNCSSNSIRYLPDSIGKLNHLLELDVSDCSRLERLPLSLVMMTELSDLNCSNCTALVQPPLSVYNHGLAVVRGYFKELVQTGAADALITVALLGEAGAGKTSVIRSLQHGHRKFTRRDGSALDEATKIVATEKVSIAGKDVVVIDFGGHKIYQHTYQFSVRAKSIPFFTVNMAEFVKLSSTLTLEEVTKQLLFDWLSHVYLSVPSLTSPAVILTHTDQLTPIQMKECKKNLLKCTEKLKDQLIDDQELFFNQQQDKEEHATRTFNKIENICSGRPLFSPDAVFEIGADMVGFQPLIEYLRKSIQQELTVVPRSWKKFANDILSTKLPYISYDSLIEKYPNLDIDNPLRHLHSTGLIMWYPHIQQLRQVIFLQLAIISLFLEGIFDHNSNSVWQHRLQNFKRTAAFPTRKVLERSYLSMQREGFISDKLLGYILSSIETPITVEQGIELLKAFGLMHGPIKSNKSDSHIFIIPLLCQGETIPLPHGELPLSVAFQFHGLPLPTHVYHQMTVELLKIFSTPTTTWRVHTNGVTIHHDEVFLQMNYHQKSSRVCISVVSPAKQGGTAWHSLKISAMAISLRSVSSWPGALFTVETTCGHCVIVNKDVPEVEDEHWWMKINPSILRVWSDCGKVTLPTHPGRSAVRCLCDGTLIPSLFKFPPSGENLSPEYVTACVEFLQNNTANASSPANHDAIIRSQWMKVVDMLNVDACLVAKLCQDGILTPDHMERLCGQPSHKMTSDEKSLIFLNIIRELEPDCLPLVISALIDADQGHVTSVLFPDIIRQTQDIVSRTKEPPSSNGTIHDIIRPLWVTLILDMDISSSLVDHLYQSGLLCENDKDILYGKCGNSLTPRDKVIEVLLILRKKPLDQLPILLNALRADGQEASADLFSSHIPPSSSKLH